MNGKGSKPRKGADFKAYWENFDKIFRKKCDICNGSGYYIVPTGANGEISEQVICEWCGGTGLSSCP